MRASNRRSFKIFTGFALALLLTWLVLRWSVFSLYHIQGTSMHPTLAPGDVVAVQKLAYGFTLPFTHSMRWQWQTPMPGDVVVFWNEQRNKVLIKRVSGLPGDTMKDQADSLQKVPSGHIYVLGDHGAKSYDSRNFGPVHMTRLIGRVAFFVHSPSRASSTLEYVGKPLP